MELHAILAPHPRKQEALIPILQSVQAEYTYLPKKAMLAIARYARVPSSVVYGIATFYAQFRFIPTGRNHISICRGTACHVGGATDLVEELEEKVGIKEGETSADGGFSIETVSCIGACGLAPTMVVNEDTYGRLTRKKVAELVNQFHAQEAVLAAAAQSAEAQNG